MRQMRSQSVANEQEDLLIAKISLDQLRKEIHLIHKKNDLYQQSLRKQIISEIRQQVTDSSKRFEMLEQLVFESNKSVKELQGQLLARV